MDLSSSQEGNLHVFITLRRPRLHSGIRRHPHPLHGPHGIRRLDRLSLQPGHRRMLRAHHGDVRYLRPSTRHDAEHDFNDNRHHPRRSTTTPIAPCWAGEVAHQFLVFSPRHRRVCHRADARVPHCRGGHGLGRRHRTTARSTDRHGGRGRRVARLDGVVDRCVVAVSRGADYPDAEVWD